MRDGTSVVQPFEQAEYSLKDVGRPLDADSLEEVFRDDYDLGTLWRGFHDLDHTNS